MNSQGPEPARKFALIPAAIALIATLNLNVPYFSLAPGPASSVGDLIAIEGVPTHPVNGRLLLTTVSLGEVTMAEAIRGWIDRDITVVPRAAIVPRGRTDDDIQTENVRQMTDSQTLAAAAALSLLGYDVHLSAGEVRIERILSGAPAEGVLREGDVIVAAGGEPVQHMEEFVQQVRSTGVDSEVTLRVRRGDEELDVRVRTMARPEEPHDPVIGVVITSVPRIELPIAVRIDAMGIGGPSAGLMFAVGIVDLLDAEDITKGRTIAGTGTITLTGEVGAVGGVQQKIVAAREAGADLFLVPERELDPACSRAGSLRVVGVANLQEAVAVLRDDAAATRTCD